MRFKNICLFLYSFIFGCALSSLPCGLFSSCSEQGLPFAAVRRLRIFGGFSCCGHRLQGTRASVVVAHRLRSCSFRTLEHIGSVVVAPLLRGMWDLPVPGIKLMSPVLSGRSFTTKPPGRSPSRDF